MGADKFKHFLVCEILVMVLVIAGISCGLGWYSFAAAPVLTMAGGFAKELHDRKTTGFDTWDLVADLFGTVTGLAFIFAGVITNI